MSNIASVVQGITLDIDATDKAHLWKSFATALGTELRRDTVILGSSGLEHSVQAIAVDDKSKRVIIVSAEASPRLASLMQVDVQATMPDTRVIVARPIVLDIVSIARKVLLPLGITEIDIARAKAFLDSAGKGSEREPKLSLDPKTEGVLSQALQVYSKADLPTVSQIMSLVMQAETLLWPEILRLFSETAATGTVDFCALLATERMAADLKAGVCPLPLYEFSEEDFELFMSGTRPDEIKERLRELGIFQYFFPPADQVALGLIDKGIHQPGNVLRATEEAPQLGHPFGASELVLTEEGVLDMIGRLKDMNYVAEGEHGVEVSEKGRSVRSLVKFRPREGFVTKLINRLSVNASISPADFLK